MAKVKFGSGIIKPFHGYGDVVAWLKKIEDVVSLLTLYLVVDVLQLYLEMDEDQQMNINLTGTQLKEVFLGRAFSACEKLKLVSWTGEHVDVYANKI